MPANKSRVGWEDGLTELELVESRRKIHSLGLVARRIKAKLCERRGCRKVWPRERHSALGRIPRMNEPQEINELLEPIAAEAQPNSLPT